MLRRFSQVALFSSAVKKQIKQNIGILNRAISQLPNQRKNVHLSRVNETLKKFYNKEDSESLQKFEKQLKFNINFLKLSNPNLDFTPQPSRQHQQQAKQVKQNNNQTQLDDTQLQIEGFNQKNVQQYKKQVKQARVQVDFSNWFQGNTDPEFLRKHKQLLERQHFGGEFWKDKQKPTLQSKKYLQAIMSQQEQPDSPPVKDQILQNDKIEIDQSDEYWEKVKR